MTRLVPILILLIAAPVAAQSAAEYYHDAAQLYIAENTAEAERAAEAGLALAPDDRKLQALLEKIRERNEQRGSGEQDDQNEADDQQQGEGDQQQDQDASGEQQPSDDGEQESPMQDEQQDEPSDEPTEEQQAEPQDEREGDAGSAGEQDEGSPQSGDGTASPYDLKPGTMSRAEAERILRAIESDELELLRDVQRRRTRPRYVEKDW